MALVIKFQIQGFPGFQADCNYRITDVTKTEIATGLVDVAENGGVVIAAEGLGLVSGDWVFVSIDDFDGSNFEQSGSAQDWWQVIDFIDNNDLPSFAYIVTGDSVQFTNPVNLTGLWDFGDGTTSYDINPVHVYANSGTYPVQIVGAKLAYITVNVSSTGTGTGNSLPSLAGYGAVAGTNGTTELTALIADIVPSASLPEYDISSTVVVTGKNLDLRGCRLLATSAIPSGSPLLRIDNSSLPATIVSPPADVYVVAKGTGVYSYPNISTEATCNGVELRHSSPVSDRFNFYVQDFVNGVVLYGSNERKAEINVYATGCDTAVLCVDDGGSIDESEVNITGGYCRTWLETASSEESGDFVFKVENSVYEEGRWGVILGGGKNIKMSGIIRGHNGNLFKCDITDVRTTWRDSVHFNDMMVIQCDDGVAFTANRVERLKGTLNLYDCNFATGATAIINNITESAGLNLIIDKCFSLYGLHIGPDNTFVNGYLNVNVSMGNVYGPTSAHDHTALYVQSAINSTFNCIELRGNVDLSGANGCTFLFNKAFMTEGFGVIGNLSAIIQLRGNYTPAELAEIPWLDQVKSVAIESFSDSGAPLIYSNGAWRSPSPLTYPNLDLISENSNGNKVLKTPGTMIHNLGDGKTYVTSGSTKTSNWNSLDGVDVITPSLTPEMLALNSRLIDALSASEEAAYDRLLMQLKSAGSLSKLTHLYLMGVSSEANSRLNIISSADPLVSNGDVTFTANQGFASPSGAGTGYLSGISVSGVVTDYTIGGQFTDVVLNSTMSTRDVESQSQARITLRGRNGTGGYVEIGTSQDSATGGTSDMNGQKRTIIGTRSGMLMAFYNNGVLENNSTVTETDNSDTFFHIARSERNMAMFFQGVALTDTEAMNTATAMEEFRVLIQL